jgi:hypothetical protein
VQEQEKNPDEYNADGGGSAPCDFKYSDTFAGIDSILQDSASVLWRKMME